jgi:hypothetical protein
MKHAKAFSRLALLLIVATLSSCDNLEWGGTEFAVVPPPPKADDASRALVLPGTENLPSSPVLYYVRATPEGGAMIPVGEVVGDSLRPLQPGDDWELFSARYIAGYLRQGTEFTLFRHGVRAGTFVVETADLPGPEVCPRLPRAAGTMELTALAGGATEFLAMAKAEAPDARRQRTVSAQPTRTMQIVGPILAERMLRARRAQLPGSWQRAMVQIHPFPVAEVRDPGYTATLLVGDELSMGGNNEGYSLFYVALPHIQATYDTVMVSFTSYPEQGKAAPRTVDFLDWNSDGQAALLLEVYGTNGSWFEAVGRTAGGTWQRIMQSPCERAGAAPVTGQPSPLIAPAEGEEVGAQAPAGTQQQQHAASGQQRQRVLGRPVQ